MLGLLVLFLTASANTGGFNWPDAMALKLMGIYTGLIFAAPALGGWISNRFWGEQRCILYGGLLVTLGHLLLGGPAYMPLLVDTLSVANTAKKLQATGLSYQYLFLSKQSLGTMLSSLPASAINLSLVSLSYHLKLWSFLIGLAFIVIGTGLIKPTVSSIINHLYPPDGQKRQTGFTIFMVSIYIGSFSANFVAGTLGEKVGWHAGFSAAALGMLIGVISYLIWQKKHLGDLGINPQNPTPDNNTGSPALTKEHKQRIQLILLMGAFTVLYAIAFYQKGGLLNLYAGKSVDRFVFGFEIPVTWFLTISTGAFILCAPFTVKLLNRLLPTLDAINKLAIGLVLIAVGYGIIAIAEAQHIVSEDKVSAGWIIAMYLLFGLGDIFVWPAQIAAAASLVPKHLTSFIVGAWYLTIGLGSWLTGYVGALSISYSHLTVFVGFACVCLFAALCLSLMRKWALSLAHNIKLY